MPELPEVQTIVNDLNAADLIGVRISGAGVFWPRTISEPSPKLFCSRIKGRKFSAIRRRGKYLWLELDEGPHPILHLGMTGTVRFLGDEPLKLSSSPNEVDRSWPPRFTKLRLSFEDGAEVAFTNARRLGRVLFRGQPDAEKPITRLGFDPLTDMPKRAQFAERIGRRKRAVLKSLLLDQSFAAGVGNWIADEVLYRAALDPRRRVESLDPDEVERMRVEIRHVIKTAVRVDARKDGLPKTWLFHHRWGKNADAKTAAGEPIEHLQIGGRTTAWVPSRQR